MATAQVTHDHRGVVTYCFFRPDPATPCVMEFLETYGSEAAFWAHAAVSGNHAGSGDVGWTPREV